MATFNGNDITVYITNADGTRQELGKVQSLNVQVEHDSTYTMFPGYGKWGERNKKWLRKDPEDNKSAKKLLKKK